MRLRPGLRPDTAGGAYSAPPETPSGIGSVSRQGKKWRAGKGREGKKEDGGEVGLPPSRISRDVPDLRHAVPRPGKTSPGTPNVPDFKVQSK